MIWLIPIILFLLGLKSLSALLFLTLFLYKTRRPSPRSDDLSPEECFNKRRRLSQLIQARARHEHSSTPPEITLENSRPIMTRIAGVSHCNKDGESRQSILKKLTTNDPIKLVRDPENSYGKTAIEVVSDLGCLGYLPSEVAENLQLANIDELTAKILSIGVAKNGLLGCRIALKVALPTSDAITSPFISVEVKPDVIPTNEQQQTQFIEITKIALNASAIEREVITNHLKLIRQSIVDKNFQVAICRAQKLHTRFQLEPKLLDLVDRIESNHFEGAISSIDEYISGRQVFSVVPELLSVVEKTAEKIILPIISVREGLSVQTKFKSMNKSDGGVIKVFLVNPNENMASDKICLNNSDPYAPPPPPEAEEERNEKCIRDSVYEIYDCYNFENRCNDDNVSFNLSYDDLDWDDMWWYEADNFERLISSFTVVNELEAYLEDFEDG